MLKYKRSRGLLRRFKSYGLPVTLGTSLEKEIEKWVFHSGPKWTVDRLKSLKQDFIRIHAGEIPLTWVRKNRRGKWYGFWGAFLTYSQSSLKRLEIALNCLMAYSSFIPLAPTEEHVESCRRAIEAPLFEVPEKLISSVAELARSLFGDHVSLGDSQPLLTYMGHSSVRSPVLGGSSVPQDTNLEAEVDWILSDPYHKLFIQRHYEVYERVFQGLDPKALMEPLPGLSGGVFYSDFGPFQRVESKIKPPFMKVPAGNLVGLTKDGGWKVRWIANPYRLHQLALRPLGQGLFSLLKTLEWDCTHDQTKPYKIIQEHLKKGRRCFAVDLTSATDYFPLQLQTAVLNSIFREKQDVLLFSELSRCLWKSKEMGWISWTVGQPMGLYPSFPSFALTHGLLLRLLGDSKSFFVLGDDVVILHPDLYEKYLLALEILKCPHNPMKSLISNRATEFAGKLITPENVVSSFKWRDPRSENFIDLMRTFGQRFRPMLRTRERRVYDTVAHLLPPMGLNHSWGNALPLNEVVALTDDFLSNLPVPKGRVVHTSFLHLLIDYLKPKSKDSLFYRACPFWARQETQNLDERVCQVFKGSPFEHLIGDKGVLMDLFERSRHLPILPPVKDRYDRDRESTLLFYERILGFDSRV